MRHMISGMVAAVAVMMTMGAAPAMACYSGCARRRSTSAPAPVYAASGCDLPLRRRLSAAAAGSP